MCVQAGHQIAHRAMTRVNRSVPKQYNTDNAYMNKICCRQAPTHDHSITVCVIVKLGLMTWTDSVGATNVMGRRRNASYNAFKGNLSSNWATFPCTHQYNKARNGLILICKWTVNCKYWWCAPTHVCEAILSSNVQKCKHKCHNTFCGHKNVGANYVIQIPL